MDKPVDNVDKKKKERKNHTLYKEKRNIRNIFIIASALALASDAPKTAHRLGGTNGMSKS